MFSDDDSESDAPVSSLEFSSDDDEQLVINKNEDYLSNTVPSYDNQTFFTHIRVSRRIADGLATRYEGCPSYHYQVGSHGKITAANLVLIFLWYAGHQTSSFRDVGDRFGISISTLHKVIHRLTKFISNLSPGIIQWPDAERKAELARAFAAKGFPGALGAIDGTHIKIDRPEEDHDSFINRKGYFSIQAQVVCDHERRIIDLFVGYPGSVHDARVFNVSPLASSLPAKCGDQFLLGDSAYPCLPNLITPYQDRGQMTDRQKRFNVTHAKNRYVVEHCFGVLKQKFRQLYHVKLRSIKDTVHFIRACCVLHNLALDDDFPEEDVPVEDDGEDVHPNHDNDEHQTGQTLRYISCFYLINAYLPELVQLISPVLNYHNN